MRGPTTDTAAGFGTILRVVATGWASKVPDRVMQDLVSARVCIGNSLREPEREEEHLLAALEHLEHASAYTPDWAQPKLQYLANRLEDLRQGRVNFPELPGPIRRDG